LLPRFEEAQSLREASIARKIAALRDSVIAALDTTIDQSTRGKSETAGQAPDLEARLRLIAGEIGELRSSLDHAWPQFGESPQSVVENVADRAVSRMRSNPDQPGEATQLSEWIHDVVQEFLNKQVEQMRGAMDRAMQVLKKVAEELASSEAPSQDQIETILRDVPRFELAAIPSEPRATRWKWLGNRVVRSTLAKSLRQSIGPLLRDELHGYGYAIRQWSDQATHRMEAVVNSYAKADRTSDPERAAAVKFTREILEKRLQRPMGEVFQVSASERMDKRGPLRGWEKLLASLHHLVEDSGRNLVRAACDRGLQRLSEQLLAIISEDRDALQRPIDESERRIRLMKEIINAAERSMRELNFLFMAEQQRVFDYFVERRLRFIHTTSMDSEEFDGELSAARGGFGPHYRRRLMQFAQEISRRRVLPWIKPEQQEGERQYRAAAIRFVEMGNNFLRKPAEAGLTELARMPHALDPEKGFRVRTRFTFEDFIGTAQPSSPLRWLADGVLPLVGGRKRITNEAREFLRHLLEVNSSRVQNDVLNRIQDSRGRLEAEIRRLLHEVSHIAEQALNRARRVKEEGISAVQSALERLDRLERDISAHPDGIGRV
jgi:hypothetical protein